MNPVLLWFHQLGSPPVFDRFAARWASPSFLVALLMMAAGLYGALFVVPAEGGTPVSATLVVLPRFLDPRTGTGQRNCAWRTST